MSTEDNSLQSYMPVDNSNPAWNDILSAVPDEYHEALTPHLQAWDKGVNERFDKIHQDYADFKSFKEDGWGKEDLEFALNLAQRVENDPKEVYAALAEYLGEQGLLDDVLGQEEPETNVNQGNFDPRFNELQNGFQTLAEAFLAQEQAKAEAEEDALLDAELAEMRERYGDFDEEYVLSKMINGMDTEDAVKSYHAFVDGILTQRNRPAPRIVGSNGDYPGQGTVDPRKLNGEQRANIIAQYLEGS